MPDADQTRQTSSKPASPEAVKLSPDAPEGLLRWSGPGTAFEAWRLFEPLGYVVILADAEASGLPAPLNAEIAASMKAAHPRGYLVRRGVARALAAQVLGGSALDYAVEQDASGAPALAGNAKACELHVSFSARDQVGVIALGRMPLGVDYEPTLPPGGIPWNILRADESSALEMLPLTQREAAFLALWRTKEAALKALGQGFSRPPEAVHISADQAWIDGLPQRLRLVSFAGARVTLAILMS